ncbi:hypothetical protein [Vibrio phage vB_VmeM-Yong XC32]|nr:hypothetical protein [Vibrio phage vB_VmeM-Yong XC31]QAX96334.1 hypothetical protein [Vibrio phage vB_VmeM-Yong XC32]QAX96652.1 hypothetical protein [Vibrio phage vB_VmeM-Yong MS31]QAX96970.1 hypothetical protein [Vibrio phage vB_VmeM-Yong MS32]
MSNYKYIDDLANHFAISPATTFTHGTRMLNDAIGGEVDIADPNNPFIGLLEINATQVAALMQRTDVSTRKRFAKLAQTLTDLYPHMSDEDFAGIFGSPNYQHVISVGLGKNQIIANAVADSGTGLRHIRIPRDTIFRADDLPFTIHQPIDISVYPNGELRAEFDSSVESPINRRQSNIIETNIGFWEGTEMFVMNIPCDQLDILSVAEPVTASTSWEQEVEIAGNFFYARGYYSSDNINWTEMHTTFDTNNFDPINPTMVVRVEDGLVRCFIPDVFIEEERVGAYARVDVYTTQGRINIDLSNSDSADWEAEWNDYSGLSAGYVAPLQNITSRIIFSTQVSTGGSDAMTFEEIKDRVIYNRFGKNGAYTGEELRQELRELGYESSLRKDTLTDRIYVASKRIDDAVLLSDTGLATGIGVISEPIAFYTGRTDLAYAMRKHTTRATILPAALYKEQSGGVSILSEAEKDALHALTPSALVDELNQNDYFYTPFYTVLDYTNTLFTSRAYWLSSPEVVYRNALVNNNALGFTASTTDVQVTHDTDKMSVKVTAARPKDVTGIHLQMTFKGDDEELYYVTQPATYLTDTTMEFTFEFGTTYDIDSSHNFNTTAKDKNHSTVDVRINLEQEFELFFIVETPTSTASSFDDKFYSGGYGTTVTAIAYENLKARFGRYLDGLFLSSRTLVQSATYELHLVDVPETYLENVYETDANGYKPYVDNDGNITFNLLHAIGDPKLDGNGDPVYLHRAGDPKLNAATGDPIIANPEDYSREVRLPLLDARFLLATDESIVAYREALPARIYEYLSKDIAELRKSVLERTNLFYEPLTNQQSTLVKVADGREQSMRTALAFAIDFQLTVPAYENDAFRAALISSAKTTLATILSSNEIAMSVITSQLKALAPDNILNVTVSNPIGSTGYASIQEALSSFSIGKTMRLQPNGQTVIVDDVSVSFSK